MYGTQRGYHVTQPGEVRRSYGLKDEKPSKTVRLYVENSILEFGNARRRLSSIGA